MNCASTGKFRHFVRPEAEDPRTRPLQLHEPGKTAVEHLTRPPVVTTSEYGMRQNSYSDPFLCIYNVHNIYIYTHDNMIIYDHMYLHPWLQVTTPLKKHFTFPFQNDLPPFSRASPGRLVPTPAQGLLRLASQRSWSGR